MLKIDITSENNIYDSIAETIKEPYKEKEKKPRIFKLKDKNLRDIIVFDLPRREDLYHGTTFSVRCNNRCYVKGDVVIRRDDEDETSDKIEKSDCSITSDGIRYNIVRCPRPLGRLPYRANVIR